jgi:hypothetical protein
MSPRSLPGVGVAACCAAAEERRGDLRSYALVTGAYWADTITDGAIRTLILFYFFKRGYSPFEVASLGAAAAKRSATLAQAVGLSTR